MTGPLHGIRVIEMTSTVSGPMAATVLADQGADVIKVEHPMFGDTARYLGSARDGMGAMFAVINRNKRSLALDLKNDTEKQILLDLLEHADVLIENYRPGVLEKQGLGYASLSATNPRLVYVSITGYGPDGPYENRRVYDPLIQATSGMAWTQGDPRTRPENVRTIIFDKVTALTAAQAVTAALLQRATTGRGQHLPISMLDSALHFSWPDVMWSRTLLGDGVRHAGELADYFPIFKAKDGHVSIILTQDEAVQAVCLWRQSELHLDPRFANGAVRLVNREAFVVELERLLADVTTDEICEMLDSFGIPVARVNSLDDVHEDEQVVHAQSLVERDHPTMGRMRFPRPPARFDGQAELASFPERHASHIGAHTREILTELGTQESVIASIEERNAAHAEQLRAVLGQA